MIRTLLFAIIFQIGNVFAQTSDQTLRKIGFLTGNNIGLSAYNDGAISGFRQGVDIRGEWPLGSGENYIGDITPCLGLELPVKDYNGDGIMDSIHSVIISRGPRNNQGNERHPTLGYFWGFNPVTAYVNENSNSFPISDDNSTWPANWNGVWPGLYNAGEIVAEKEAFFKMDDYWDDEFNEYFHPIESDSSITGHGIEVSVRLMQFNSLSLEDVFFRVYDITNNSDHNYEKVFLGNVTGTLMGGDGDSGDDMADLDDSTGIIYSWDADGIGNVGQKTAIMCEAFIETPSFNDIGEFDSFWQGRSPDMSNDSLLWDRFTKPNRYNYYPPIPQDGDLLYSTKLFSLNSGETKRVVSVIAFDYFKDKLENKVFLAEAMWHNQFNTTQLQNRIKLINFAENSEFSNAVPITWQSSYAGGKVDLYYSGDFGKTWNLIAKSLANKGSYGWDSQQSNVEESAFGQIKIILEDGYLLGYSTSNNFLLNKSGNGKPRLEILNEDALYSKTLTEDSVELFIMVGDSEKENLKLNLYYKTSINGSYQFIEGLEYPFSNIAHLYNLNLLTIPNSEELFIKFELKDSENEFIYETSRISKRSEREAKTNEYITKVSGFSESSFNVYVVAESALLPEKYLITFDDASSFDDIFYNVEKISDGTPVLENELLQPNVESKVFNGIVFETDFVKTKVDTIKSKWNTNVSKNFIFSMQPFVNPDRITDNGYGLPNDYKIVFYDSIVDTSITDTLYKTLPPFRITIPTMPVNFKIWNTTKNREVDFTAFNSGVLSSNLSIWLHEENLANIKRTWRMNIYLPEPNMVPVGNGGDTLYLVTQKGFSVYDSLIIENLVVGVKSEDNIPYEYSLSQNYPNPFNPSTTIQYSIPGNVKSELVNIKLVIFDILGREVVILVNKNQKAGNYEVNFDASNLSSGVYLYRLNSGSFTKSMKMLLLK